MPELPEVEAVRLGVAELFTGARIAQVQVFDNRALTRHAAGVEDFRTATTGRVIRSAERRGKFLWLPLVDPSTDRGTGARLAPGSEAGDAGGANGDPALLAHLGMSGQLRAHDFAADAAPLRHERVRLIMSDRPERPRVLSFHDQRLFGSLAVDRLAPDVQPLAPAAVARVIPTQAAHIASDPLEPGFDFEAAVHRIRRPHSAIKRVLLDQRAISGIGNIYADESLWAARVHPAQLADSLSLARTRTLLEAVISVLRRAVAVGGTSFDEQYRRVNGAAGYFAIELNAYGRTGQPCPRCGRPIVQEAFANRHSHLCRNCQRVKERAS